MIKILHVYYETHRKYWSGREQSLSERSAFTIFFTVSTEKWLRIRTGQQHGREEWAHCYWKQTLRKQGDHLAQFVGYINNWILGELGDFWFVLFANFHGVNRPTMVDFKLSLYHWMLSWIRGTYELWKTSTRLTQHNTDSVL